MHYEIFERDYEQKFVKIYGYRRAVVDYVVRNYLKCGDLREGFARVRCPVVVTRTCSLSAVKVVQFGALLRNNILYPVSRRQYVFTLPKTLRINFKHDRKLLSKLCHCAKVV